MNVENHPLPGPVPTGAKSSRTAIADCDIHPVRSQPNAFDPWLPARWRAHLQTYGAGRRLGMQAGPAYPKSQPNAARRDAVPPEGGPPGSSLAFMQAQHLDPNNVALGILNPLQTGQGIANPELSAAICHATNQWQVAEWTSKDKRLRASVLVPYEFTEAAAAEIRHWAGHKDFAQVLVLSRTGEPLGNRRYWPIYEAACEAGLPVAVHAFGYGGAPISSTGWPSHYIEEMTGHAQSCQAGLASMVIEGIFERFPTLKVVMVEAGFAWAPAFGWRLDKVWEQLRTETPHLRRKPSEYLREHVWWTSQPMEEPEPRTHLLDTIDWMGWDRVLFATDYPHWDFDDPALALAVPITDAQRKSFFLENAKNLYGVQA
ncbi:MAG TPA: amidohydrolase family protein [Acidisoma sp.]|jgi:predicted TIM-barrel fold metal-dependent hydrolase|uniref:amidohydrolase family protein n=1 Tax=Acidisoma sp. TaxID=1872115 RepID=UPI002CB4A080|nr:amidohydrolase family protein [Acidisoma sp.]HTI02887.1 amidohydrolase family protein [Acidisoma sp.]